MTRRTRTLTDEPEQQSAAGETPILSTITIGNGAEISLPNDRFRAPGGGEANFAESQLRVMYGQSADVGATH
jgi:hypothetical protein